MNFGWLVIICETYVLVCDVVENLNLWLSCDDLWLWSHFAYLMACSSSRSSFEANPCLIFSDTYTWLLPWSLFCRGNSVKIYYIYAYVWKSNENYKHICRGISLYILVLETFTLSIYWTYLRRVSDFKIQNLSYITPLNDCHQLPKRGRLKASRPLIRFFW
jgi:hypothetical protein